MAKWLDYHPGVDMIRKKQDNSEACSEGWAHILGVQPNMRKVLHPHQHNLLTFLFFTSDRNNYLYSSDTCWWGCIGTRSSCAEGLGSWWNLFGSWSWHRFRFLVRRCGSDGGCWRCGSHGWGTFITESTRRSTVCFHDVFITLTPSTLSPKHADAFVFQSIIALWDIRHNHIKFSN